MDTTSILEFERTINTKGDWLKKRKDKWERNIHVVNKTAEKYPQEINAAVDHEIQSEWIFLQHVTKYTVPAFEGLGGNM